MLRVIPLDVPGTFVWGVARIVPGYLLGGQVQVALGYSLGERFGELDLRLVQPLQGPTELGHPAGVLLCAQ